MRLLSRTSQFLVILTALVSNTESWAVKPCPTNVCTDSILDLTQFNEDLSNQYFIRRINGQAEYDLRQEIDLSRVHLNDPMYALNALGRVFNRKKNAYVGSGYLISPCHVLTVHHNIEQDYVDIPKETEVGFSYGQNDKNPDEFLWHVKGRVVVDDPIEDYTILKIDSLRGKVNTLFLERLKTEDTTLENHICLSVGYPILHSKSGNLNKSFGMKSRFTSDDEALYIHGNINLSHGDSGGGVVCVDLREKKLKSVGLHQSIETYQFGASLLNGARRTMANEHIYRELSERYPAVMKEITAAVLTKRCE